MIILQIIVEAQGMSGYIDPSDGHGFWKLESNHRDEPNSHWILHSAEIPTQSLYRSRLLPPRDRTMTQTDEYVLGRGIGDSVRLASTHVLP